MFIIKSLHLENFMSVDSADFEFADNQITAITGQNGQGKSSLFLSVAYCLTGYRKGESVKNYVKTGTEVAKIHLEGYFKGEPIVYDMEIYNSTKHPQPTSKKIIYLDKTYLNSEYNQFIEEFGLEELEALMFMLQGSSDIIESKPAERAARLKKLFRFEFNDTVDKLKSQQEENKTKSVEQTAVVNELSSHTYDKLQLMRETAPVNITNWENRLGEIDSSLTKIGDVDETAIDSCESEIINVQRSVNAAESKLSQDKLSIEKLQSQIKDIETFLDGYDIDVLQVNVDKSKKDIAQHEVDYNSQREVFDKLNEELSILQYKETELSKQYEISKTGICHACGQPVEKEHVESLQKELEETSKSIKEKKSSIFTLAFDRRDLRGQELRKELSYNEDLVKKYNNEVRNKETILVRMNDLSNLITERENGLKGLKSGLEVLVQKKANLSSMIDLIKAKNDLIEEKKEVEGKLQDARDNKIKNAERRLTNERLEREQKERDKRVADINEKLNDLSIEAIRLKEEIEIFETRFPNFIVLQACEKLEEVINSIVQKVFQYCRVSLKLSKGGVNFFYTSESSDEEWIPVSMASGAQRQILSLAYFIALARLSGITCIFLDEIDASMSAENAAIVYDFIGGLDYFDQVFFISHRPEAHEAVKLKNDKLVTYSVENGNYTEI